MHNLFVIKKYFGLTILAANLSVIAAAQAPRGVPATYPASAQTRSYIRTWDAKAPEQNPNIVVTRALRDVQQTTQYFDGLGRPLQTVIKQGSLITSGSTSADVIAGAEYDQFGREQFKYLPSPSTAADATKTDGNFKPDPFAQQALFYNSANTLSPLYNQGETFFYGQTNFEQSPLNRVSEAASAGNSWVGTMGNTTEITRKSVKIKYYVNTSTDGVRIWNVTPTTDGTFSTYQSIVGGIYPAGTLIKTISIDEENNQIVEFKDRAGKVILKKVQVTAVADDGITGSNHARWLCTYYLYDDLNNLRCVIQPQGIELIAIDNWTTTYTLSDATSIVAEQCFRYEYDDRNRLIVKKVPGAKEVYMIYDKKDRLVMMQDGNLRVVGRWMVTLYDALNRPVQTGLLYNTWDGANKTFGARLIDGAAISADYPFASTATPAVTYWEYLTKTGYDDYSTIPVASAITNDLNASHNGYFTGVVPTDYAEAIPPAASFNTRGMPTWTETKVLDKSIYTWGVMLYNDKGRLLQVKSKNITTGADVATTQYNWLGQPLISVQEQVKGGTPTQTNTTVSKLTYDDLGRVVKTEKKIGNNILNTIIGLSTAAYNTMALLQYDALGQLKNKTLGAAIEKLNYDYNIRGWLLGMNRSYLTIQGQGGSNKFGYELAYDKLTSSTTQSFTAARFNGNIAGMSWKSDGDDVRRIYNYSYDNLNRLMKADFKQQNPDDNLWNNTLVNYSVQMGDGTTPTTAYDANGNILNMVQYGLKLGVSSGTPVDNLIYNYKTNSNQLLNVIDLNNDAATPLGDFRTSTNYLLALPTKNVNTIDYTYDDNGNLLKDLNKDIGTTTTDGIQYNHLNLPQIITVKKDNLNNNKGTITYTYDATGNKLRKQTIDVGITGKTITTTTTYLAALIFESKTTVPVDANNPDYTDKLLFAGQEEGRIRALYTNTPAPNTITGFVYDYFIKDHLGNTRMVLTDDTTPDTYPDLSFEGTAGTTEVNNQNAIWEKADGTPFDIIAKRIVSPAQLSNGIALPSNTVMVPSPLANSLLVRNSTGKVGAGKLLKVMAGDKIHTTVQYYYSNNTEAGSASGLNTLVSALANVLVNSAYTTAAFKANPTAITNPLNVDPNATGFFSPQNGTTNNGRPKAFLNILFFDEQFKFDNTSSYSEQIKTTTSDNPGQIVIALQNAKQAKKNGFCYVYISNETNDMVYFDNFTLKHERGQILEETHYYPFGLTMEGISSKAAGGLENKRKWNKGSELESKEFSDGSGLELYSTQYRSLDPQLGRFWQIDPKPDYAQSLYSSMNNNPISFNDPLGDTASVRWGTGFLGLKRHEARYVGGQWIDSKTRNGVDANNVGRKGASRIMNDYKTLNGIKDFNPVTSAVNNATNDVRLSWKGSSETGANQYFSDLKNGNANPTIGVSASGSESLPKQLFQGENNQNMPSYMILGHELGHVLDLLNSGTNISNFTQIPGLADNISNSEVNAMYWENVLRKDANMPLRLWYHYDNNATQKYQLGANVSTSGIMTFISDLNNTNMQLILNGL